jgi:ribosomal protein S12 methylthiotransferase
MGRVGFVSLGCPKALVDSERILTSLRAAGYELVDDYEDAEVVVVNTCGFITPAVEESLDAIGEALERNGAWWSPAASGAPRRDPRPAPAGAGGDRPGRRRGRDACRADAVPLDERPFTALLPAGQRRRPPRGARVKLTPRHYAYLKIAEGCDHRCSFCIIPSMRGDQVSRDAADVLFEATRLVATRHQGAGGDRPGLERLRPRPAPPRERLPGRPVAAHLVPLVRELSTLGAWVRLHYVYPYPHVRELIPLMAEGTLLPYLDVPLQHASPRVLRAMRRPGGAESHLATIRGWREVCPELVIRSSFIVGFPGETEDDVELLLDFLEEAQLDRVGVFTYSEVPGRRRQRAPRPRARRGQGGAVRARDDAAARHLA